LELNFIGVNPDESCDDIGSLQLPQSWKQVVLENSVLDSLFQIFSKLSGKESLLALEVLGLVASARRSLFTDLEKTEFLDRILVMAVNIMTVFSNGVEDDTYHLGVFYR
jgi:exportin-7